LRVSMSARNGVREGAHLVRAVRDTVERRAAMLSVGGVEVVWAERKPRHPRVSDPHRFRQPTLVNKGAVLVPHVVVGVTTKFITGWHHIFAEASPPLSQASS